MTVVENFKKGFTIVELLIVIVIIAVLAAITIVAYNGVQNRANDTVIQSDLDSLNKKIRLVEVDLGKIPPAGSRVGSATSFPLVKFSPTKSAYSTNGQNLSYCEGTLAGVPVYAITAKSKSGNVFKLSSSQGMQNLGQVAHGALTACGGMDAGSTGYSYGFYFQDQKWWPWANG